MPIVSGVNRGMWWTIVSAGSGYASGSRARVEMNLLSMLIRPGDVVWDVGAHHGYVTLCASRRVGSSGRVHAFEPSGRNRDLLKRHVRWNRCRNVSVHQFALSNRDGEDFLGGEGTSKTLSLGKGTEVVAVRSARSIVKEGLSSPPTFIKIDVEGAEADVLAGMMDVLPRNARLFIEMHTIDADKKCDELMRDAGFQMYVSSGLQSMRAGERRMSDPDLYCVGPDCRTREQDFLLLQESGF